MEEYRNPQSREDAYDRSLSGRLPPQSTTCFQWREGEVLQIQDDVGPLGVLSLNLIHDILQQLDIASLRRLGRVSKGMHRAVGSLPKLRAVVHCAPDAMRAIWAAKMAPHLTFAGLYEELCRPTCAFCDKMAGEYLFLLSCERVCRSCLLTQRRYVPLRPAQVCEQFYMHREDVQSLPRLRVPKYSRYARTLRQQRRTAPQRNTTGWLLIDREVAACASIRFEYKRGNFDPSSMADEIREEIAELRTRQPVDDLAQHSFIQPAEYSYSAAVLFPWLDRATDNVGRPVSCRACRFSGSFEFHCATVTNAHIKKHGRIVNGVHVPGRK